MANPTSKLNLVINGTTTQLDIHDANAVDLTSNQTVGGIKTFSNAPVVGSILLDGKTIDTDANDNLIYDSHIVDTIEEQGNGYIRYSNGLQICWGGFSNSSNIATGKTQISYPMAFISLLAVTVSPENLDDFYHAQINTTTTTQLTTNIYVYDHQSGMELTSNGISIRYIAIGNWK